MMIGNEDTGVFGGGGLPGGGDGLPGGGDGLPGGNGGDDGGIFGPPQAWLGANAYLVYMIALSAVIVITGAFLHFALRRKRPVWFCAIAGLLCFGCSNTLMYLALRFNIFDTTPWAFLFTYWDLSFFIACLSPVVYSFLVFSGKPSARLFYPLAACMLFTIISLLVYTPLPSDGNYIELYISVPLLAALLVPAWFLRKRISDIIAGVPDVFVFILSGYAFLTTLALQIWRTEVVDLKLYSAMIPAVLSAVLFVLMFVMLYQLKKKSDITREKTVLAEVERAERQNYETLLNSLESVRIAHHDYRHHLRTALNMLSAANTKKARDYLASLEAAAAADVFPHVCENVPVDSIVKYYARLCRDRNLAFDFKITIPEETGISETDLCSAISNCLENSMKASDALPEKEREIRIRASVSSGAMIIKVWNKCVPGAETSRADGLGLLSVQRIAHKYDGEFSFSEKDGEFETLLVLQRPIAETERGCAKKANAAQA